MRQLSLFDTGFYIEKIRNIEAIKLFSQYHYLGGVSKSAQSFGSFINGQLMGVVSFGVPVSENVRRSIFGDQYKNHVMELSRLCLHPQCDIPASKIVSQSIQEFLRYRKQNHQHEINALISFADTNQGHHGGVYQSMSWDYIGTSDFMRKIYTDPNGRIRSSRQCGIEITPKMARERGWSYQRVRSIKHRYIKILGSKNQKKFFKSRLIYTIQPYPKS